MTRVPRFGAWRSPCVHNDLFVKRLGGLRHVVCSVMVSGCLYTQGIVQPPDNAPPELVVPTPEQAQEVIPFRLNRPDENILVIVARDMDDDELEIVWTMPPFDSRDFESVIVRSGGTTSFRLVLPGEDDTLDGLLVTATVLDPIEGTDVTFQLEVP